MYVCMYIVHLLTRSTLWKKQIHGLFVCVQSHESENVYSTLNLMYSLRLEETTYILVAYIVEHF